MSNAYKDAFKCPKCQQGDKKSAEINPGADPNISYDALLEQMESLFDRKIEIIKQNMIEELKKIILPELISDITDLRKSIKGLESSHNKLLEDFTSYKNKNNVNLTKIQDTEAEIMELRAQINKQQQYARMKNLEIAGLPEIPNESLTEAVIKIAGHAGVQISSNDIKFANRVQPMRKNTGKPKTVIVKLRNRGTKDKILSGLRKTKGISTADVGHGGESRQIYVHEHLTPVNKMLLYKAKERATQLSYKFVWIRDCHIFLRKDEKKPLISVNSLKDLEKIV